MDHGPGHDHASDAQSSDSLRNGAAGPTIPNQTALQDVDHRAKHGFENVPGTFSASCDICWQGDHGAGILDVFEMLPRQIGAHDLGTCIPGRQVYLDAFPTA